MKMPIDPDKEYLASEIADNGFILSKAGNRSYRAIRRLIQFGKLKAKTISIGNKGKFDKVKGSDIIAFLAKNKRS